MNPVLHDLLEHQFWADAESWNAIGAHAAARDDNVIRRRLHHIHLVQRAFAWRLRDRGERFAASRPEDFSTFDSLREYAKGSHRELQDLIDSLTEDRLVEVLDIPWFKEPPLSITVTEALTQVAMHSQNHRGQNATRLRELGGETPTTDLILWYWKGRPAPQWGA